MGRRHQHTWVIAAVYVPPSGLAAVAGGVGSTVILWRCTTCSGPDSLQAQVLPGVWTLSDLDASRDLVSQYDDAQL